MVKITGMQLRMARSALKWRVDDLSKASGVGWARVQNMEKSNETIENEQVKMIIDTLTNKGVNFMEEDNFLPYVKLKKND